MFDNPYISAMRALFLACVVTQAGTSGQETKSDSPRSGDRGNIDAQGESTTESKLMKYPSSRKSDTIDNYFGRMIPDPYRWLEDVESAEVSDWVVAQNKVTDAYLQSLPARAPMRKRLEELWNYERFGLPEKKGASYFYFHNNGLQNQNILYVASSLGQEPQVLIDPNVLAADGTLALGEATPSDDGTLMAYSIADGGSDWRTWKVREVATGKDRPDEIRWSKFSDVAWLPDGSGFFYAAYDAPADGVELTGTNEFQKLYLHMLGSNQSDDRLVMENRDEPTWGFQPRVTDDGRYLIIHNWKGSEPKSQIFVKRLGEPNANVQPLVTGFDADYEFVGSDADTIFLMTDDAASRRRLVAIHADKTAREDWVQVIPESADVLQSVTLFGNEFVASYLHDAVAKVVRFSIDGKPLGEISLPGLGTVTGFDGPRNATETFYSFENQVTPTAIYRYDVKTGTTSLWREPKTSLDRELFMIEQVFFQSADGTRVPMLITRKREAKLDGTHRTLLYGYGGFNIAITPNYSPAIAAWVEAGGVYAVVNMRGGGEYGREWHEAGMRLNKQRVFDDFIAAAEYLIDHRYTSKQKLAVQGRSNGGLLIGAVMTQHPDLFAVCLPAVGVMDMLRYHKFTIGWAWTTEFGSSDEPDQIENLLSYSPLHNVRQGVCYPATLITTADRDDRVVPGHSFKFAAALQTAQGTTQSCSRPTLIRIETRAGHGAGTPVSKRIEEYADLWSFVIENTP